MRKTAHIPPPWWLTDTAQTLSRRGCEHLAVYVALTTGPSSHVSGVAYIPPYDLAHLLNLTVDRVQQVIADMEQDGVLVYDTQHSIVWIVGAIETQLGSPRWRDHPKWLDPTISYLESLPASIAIERFLDHYRLIDRIAYRYPIGRVSVGYEEGTDTLSVGSSYPFLSSPPSSPSPERPTPPKFRPLDDRGLDLEEDLL